MCVGRYVLVSLMGIVVTLLQCPHCHAFVLLKHGTLKAHKTHLCEECERWFIEPSSAHFTVTLPCQAYVHEDMSKYKGG